MDSVYNAKQVKSALANSRSAAIRARLLQTTFKKLSRLQGEHLHSYMSNVRYRGDLETASRDWSRTARLVKRHGSPPAATLQGYGSYISSADPAVTWKNEM
ncbi:hypothetical protein NDU88_006826 [Pleurodeles waltl]|uniref:Uncharacterized protein n=1 Tax=Pleurodeles waltl TaxID=8319 RepID=A0AAV7QJ11_PLEWA|nr:hypothetical protein NDU88_006826 [Pleurodeles waltl]